MKSSPRRPSRRLHRPGRAPSWWRLAPGALLACAVLNPVQAEDIDIYASSSGGAGANVLFLLDNTSNWSANNQSWSKSGVLDKCPLVLDPSTQLMVKDPTCVADTEAIFGSNSSLEQGRVQVRALKRVINRLVCSSDASSNLNVNIGLMLLSSSKGSSDNSNWVGGWMLKAVEPTNAAACTRLIARLDQIDSNIQDSNYKAASDAPYGGALFEAFKYFGGHSNPAGATTPVASFGFGPQRYTNAYSLEDPAAFIDEARTTYKSPIGSASGDCGAINNYLVLVGNTFPNLEATTSGGSSYDSALTRLGYNVGQVEDHGNRNRYADEWVQFLNKTDLHPTTGQQNLTTYVMNIYNASESTDQTRLLKSMAKVGGAGVEKGYFEVKGDLSKMINAYSDILINIAETPSVFASASLPVSVNTQGTYLNQVFMGMFRPAPDGLPRWSGNLKQYKFSLGSDGSMFLSDRDGRAALDKQNTGFIDACSNSFWTGPSGSYWANVPVEQTPLSTCIGLASNARHSDEPDGNIVEKGGAAQRLRQMSPADRILRTCTTLACTGNTLVPFSDDNVTTLAGNVGYTMPAGLAGWIRGQNTGDGPRSGGALRTYGMGTGTTTARPTIHGDVVHARPLAINYGSSTSNDVVVFYGAGDGWLRAVNGAQSGTDAGKELWAFFAPEFLKRMNRLRENSELISFATAGASGGTPKDYFFDGSIGAYMERSSSAVGKLYLYPTMRRGGRMVYAFDASNRPSATNPPALKWKFGCPEGLASDTGCTTGASGMGQSWSTPRPFRVKGNSNVYVVFGGGYHTCEDTDSCGTSTKGQGLYILDADTGALASHVNLASDSLGGTQAGRVIADVVPVDVNSDGYADLLYAVDTRGNVWRVNLSNRDNSYTGWPTTDWAGKTYRIAKVANWSGSSWTQRRKFQYAPDVVVLGDTAWVLAGTGDREQPLPGANASKVKNRFYAFRDDLTKGGRSADTSTPTLIDDSADCDAAGNTTLTTGCQLLNVTTLTDADGAKLNYSTTLANAATRGWVIDLKATTEPYEHVITTPVTVGGYVYFSTYQAKNTGNSCTMSLGTSRGYAVSLLDGSKRPNDDERSAEFKGGGFAPSPVAGVVEIGDKKKTFLLGGRDSASFLEVAPPEVLLGTRRRKLYRYEVIDSQ